MGTILLGLNVDQIQSHDLRTLVAYPGNLGTDKLIASHTSAVWYLLKIVLADFCVINLMSLLSCAKLSTYSAMSIAQIPVPHPRSNMRGGSFGFT